MQSDIAAAALAGLAKRRVLAVAVLRQGRMVWASPALLTMFSLDTATATGKRFLDLVAADDRGTMATALDETPGAEAPPTSFRALRLDGSQFDAELTGSAFDLPGGPGAVIAVNDVTEQRRAQTQLSYLAFRDPLTELPNRALFFDRLRQALVEARRHSSRFAVLVSDLDGFKLINDRYGHETGDALLQVAAKRLRAATREGDTVARIGGDEFSALLARAASQEDASIVASRMVRALDAPIVVAGQPCQVGISVGIALYPGNGKDMDSLVAHADAAMYAAKRAGGKCFKFAGERDPDISGPLRLPFLEWNEAHTVGVPLMDEQHKQLAALDQPPGRGSQGRPRIRSSKRVARDAGRRGARPFRRRGAPVVRSGARRGCRAPSAGAPQAARGVAGPGGQVRRPQHGAHHALPELLAAASHRDDGQAARQADPRARHGARRQPRAGPDRRIARHAARARGLTRRRLDASQRPRSAASYPASVDCRKSDWP